MIQRPLTTAEAAELTGLPEGTLRWYRSVNKGPRSYMLGRRAVYDPADLEQWMTEQKAATIRGGSSGTVGA